MLALAVRRDLGRGSLGLGLDRVGNRADRIGDRADRVALRRLGLRVSGLGGERRRPGAAVVGPGFGAGTVTSADEGIGGGAVGAPGAVRAAPRAAPRAPRAAPRLLRGLLRGPPRGLPEGCSGAAVVFILAAPSARFAFCLLLRRLLAGVAFRIWRRRRFASSSILIAASISSSIRAARAAAPPPPSLPRPPRRPRLARPPRARPASSRCSGQRPLHLAELVLG